MPESPHTHDPTFVVFRDAAEAYCTEVEAVGAEPLDSADERALVLRLRARVAALVAAAVALPDVEVTTSDTSRSIDHAAWTDRFAALDRALGSSATYWTALPTGVGEADIALVPLADDLADIWRDLRSALDWLDSGADPADVVWEWQFGFETHWGLHAVQALRALHATAASS